MVKNVNNTEKIFAQRMEKHQDELRWLYMELYGNDAMYAELCEQMHDYYLKRSTELKKRDIKKEKNPDWFKEKEMLGMMLYVDNFAGNLKGVEKKLAYLKECNVNCIHLMPFLDTPKGKSDGGYAVADFRKVRPDLGTMKDLARLTEKCHENGMNVCMDFVMNHTSEEHEWAKRARAGEGEYMSRYFFYDNGDIPARYEETVPQVFPTTAPGNFTWLPEIGHYVLTTFYPYQWDLNYRNPRVFNEMMYNFLFLANQGMDIIRIDAVPYIWKELGTSCRNLKEVHTIVATEVEGVASMAGNITNELIGKLGMKNLSKGVKVDVLEGIVTVSLALNLKYNYSIVEVSARVQEKVKNAIENMTGLEVADVNIKVAGVEMESQE